MSPYICRRCGLGVDATSKGNWRHLGANRHRPSCGKRPDVVDRQEFDREMGDILDAVGIERRGG